MVDRVQLGNRIMKARKERGLTLKDVANAIGVAASTIQRYEKGQFSAVKMPVIEAIAYELKVNPAWLVGRTDDPYDYDTDEDGILSDMPDEIRKHLLSMGLSVEEAYKRYNAMYEETPALEIEDERLDSELIERLVSLSPDELRLVDAFVRGLEAMRKA